MYDPVYDSFYVDTNKFFGTSARLDNTYYCWSDVNPYIFIDNISKDDDWWAIVWERYSPNLSLWNPNLRKEFREINFFGEIDSITIINVEVFIDWLTVFAWAFSQNGQWMAGIWAYPVAGITIAGQVPWSPNTLTPFEKRITYTNLYGKGKKIQVLFSGQNKGWDFCLSGMSIKFKPICDSKTTDKF